MELSFIILNYKSKKYLEACIASIFKKVKKIQFEIVIINNDEEKIDTKDLGSEYRKELKILEINKNIGFAKANNQGAKISRGKYLCFINPDANILSDNIEDVIDEFEKDNKVGIVGPKILNKNKIQKWSVGVDLNIEEILKGKLGLSKSKKIWNSSEKIEADWVSGVSMFIKKDVFVKLNGFDEDFFLYYEDVDLCRRAKNLKNKIIYFPFFEVDHLEGGSSDKKYVQKIQYFKSQDYYYKKWFSRRDYYILKVFRFFYLWRYKIKQGR